MRKCDGFMFGWDSPKKVGIRSANAAFLSRSEKRRNAWRAPLLVALLTLGCGVETNGPVVDAPAPNETTAVAETAGDQAREEWHAIYMQGKKAGHGHTTIQWKEEEGRKVRVVRSEYNLAVRRFDEESKPSTAFTSIETPTGQLVRFESTTTMGPSPIRAMARVEGDQLVVEKTSQGNTERETHAWSANYGGPQAVDDSLRSKPMSPGQQRQVRYLDPTFLAPVTASLEAKQYENTPLLGESEELLRIEVATEVPGGQTLRHTLWADRQGTPRKMRSEVIGQQVYLTTREKALAPGEDQLDIGFSTTVPLRGTRANPHQAPWARYRIRLADGDAADLFPTTARQRVRSIGDGSAEVEVRPVRPAANVAGPAAAAESPPSDAERAPNNYIQSDDPLIQKLAQQAPEDGAPGDGDGPWSLAQALERQVDELMVEVEFSQALATAAEVAQSRRGDCTEHAVLLAALARAREIPSRVAMGLVYVPNLGGFAFHMWTEVYVSGAWYPLDATRAGQPVGPGHLKIADSHLKGAEGLASFLRIGQALGRLEIEALEVGQ